MFWIYKYKIIILIIIITIFKLNMSKKNLIKNIKTDHHHSYIKNHLKVLSFYDLSNKTIENKTILIFEPNRCHHECLPGYTKYFIDLGFNVDILINYNRINSFYLFKEIENIRIVTFNNLKEIYLNANNLSFIIRKYQFILVETSFSQYMNLFIKLDILNANYSFFVSHDTKYEKINYLKYSKQNRIWTLGNFSRGLYVNPHYIGYIKIPKKNKKVRFYLTSTPKRNYKYLVQSITRLKRENLNFEIIVTGRSKTFTSKNISKYLNDIFIFKNEVSYYEMFKLVENSDYIIIPLNPKNKNDNEYKYRRVTGSIQLVYGFLKPAIINKDFSSFYYLNNKNSLIYNNTDFYNIMKKAILLSDSKYNNLRHNLMAIEKKIYNISINNIKKVLNIYH